MLAHITPTFGRDGAIVGYHSNRRWVAPTVRAEVGALYATLRRAESGPGSKQDRIAAGAAALESHLAGSSYDEFVWSLAGRREER